jgi:hypothetical protein
MHPVDMIKAIQEQANTQFINLLSIQRDVINNPETVSPQDQLRIVGSMLEIAGMIRGLSYALTITPSINEATSH